MGFRSPGFIESRQVTGRRAILWELRQRLVGLQDFRVKVYKLGLGVQGRVLVSSVFLPGG